jgi:hypothetical protein
MIWERLTAFLCEKHGTVGFCVGSLEEGLEAEEEL